MNNALEKTLNLIDNLVVEDFDITAKSCIKTFMPKEIINSAKKIKKENGEIVYKVKMPYALCDFINFEPINKQFEISESVFKNFIDFCEDADEIERNVCYICAILNKNKSSEIYDVCAPLFNEHYKTKFGVETIGLKGYGYANFSIPCIKNAYKYGFEDKVSLVDDIKNYLKETITNLYNWSNSEVVA